MILSEIKSAINSLVSNANDSLLVFTAYCKISPFLEINKNERISRKILIIRGRKSDFISGASDIEILQLALSSGWSVYINKNLHAKMYCIDEKKALIGSANLTNGGVKGNLELMTEVEIGENDIKKIRSIIKSSTKIDQDNLDKMISFLSDIRDQRIKEHVIEEDWDFERTNEIHYLFPEELLLPCSINSLSSINAKVLGVSKESSDKIVFNAFIECNEYKWLIHILRNSKDRKASFGELSMLLHNSIISNDRVYRGDVKKYLSNLQGWIEKYSDRQNVYFEKLDHTTLFILR